jgi:glycerol transport system ATP-binding protein
MAEIRLQNLAHSYDPANEAEADFALKPVDLTWEDGKTYALLGPSGCGKTTMLNIISGLVKPSHGQLVFDGKDVTALPTSQRNIAQVFQFPVIYGTMTVAQNLAFPLVCRNVPDAKIKARVDSVAELLDLTDMLKLPARKLSADQKQLISLGRGLVRDDVNAILLDEPLTVIDPQMKFELRRKLKQINREAGVTMVYVTHDQTEAMTFAEEVVVMDGGRIKQVGTPEDLFERPQNTFVGYFIGSPPMNFLKLEASANRLHSPAVRFAAEIKGIDNASSYTLGFRAERLDIVDAAAGSFASGTVERVDFLGLENIVSIRLAEGSEVKVKTGARDRPAIGSEVGLRIEPRDCLVYRDGTRV